MMSSRIQLKPAAWSSSITPGVAALWALTPISVAASGAAEGAVVAAGVTPGVGESGVAADDGRVQAQAAAARTARMAS